MNGPCVKVNVTAADRLEPVTVDVIAGSASSSIMTLFRCDGVELVQTGVVLNVFPMVVHLYCAL